MDEQKTREELINELAKMRHQIAQLEAAEDERKQIEKALRASEKRFRDLYENAPNAFFSVGADGLIRRCNLRAEELLGYTTEDLVGRPVFELYANTPQGKEKASKVFERFLAGAVVIDEELQMQKANGTLVWVALTVSPARDDCGRVVESRTLVVDITERKRAEETLKESEEKLRLIFENAFDGISIYEELLESGTRRLIDCNERYAEMSGRSKQELFHIGNTSLIQKNLGPLRSREENWRIRRERLSYKGLVSWVRPDGKENIIEYSAAPIQVGDRALTVGVDRDITERIRTEEALRRRAAELEALAQVSSALRAAETVEEMLPIVLEKALQTLDAALGSIFLAEPQTGDLVSRACHPPDFYPSGVRHPVGQGITGHVAATGEIYIAKDLARDPLPYILPEEAKYLRAVHSQISLPLRTRDRIIGVMHIGLGERRTPSDEEVRLSAAMADIAANALHRAMVTEGLEAEVMARTVEIRNEQEKSEVILRSVGDAIALTDREARVLYVNPAFCTLTGYKAEEIVRQPMNALMAEELSEQDRWSLQHALVNEEQWQGEIVAQRKDGRTYDAALTVAPVRDAKGNLVGYVTSHSDISRFKELDRARNRFMTNVSHELRTPVTNIKLFTHLLQKGMAGDKTDLYLRTLGEQADRLGELIQDILEMTTLDSGQAVTRWEPVSLPTIIGSVVSLYESQTEALGLTLMATPMPPDLPVVKGDEPRLAQALEKLVDNAVIFTPIGGHVTVEVETVGQDGQHWVTIAVHDTGPGISPEEQGHVFDRFYRGSLAESGHIPGSGLGLSIAQEIMRAHGGRVTVESHEGQGSTFTLWLRSTS